MTSESEERARKLAAEAAQAVKNAKMRSRLRGESVELVIADERLEELAGVLAE